MSRGNWEKTQEWVRNLSGFPHAAPDQTSIVLGFAAARDRARLHEKWDEEAQQAALDGRPERAHYIETFWLPRVRRV